MFLRRLKVHTLPSWLQLSASMGTGFMLSSRSTTLSYTSWLTLTMPQSLHCTGLMEE